VTGSSKVPLAGFAGLQGMSGLQKLTIDKDIDSRKLPLGHTCFNSLDLPEYPTFEMLKERVTYAIDETSGFGFG